jgi:hypothetical protein
MGPIILAVWVGEVADISICLAKYRGSDGLLACAQDGTSWLLSVEAGRYGVEPDMIPFAATFSNSARLNISDDGPAQLLFNLPLQPPMDATRPILQDLNLSFDI